MSGFTLYQDIQARTGGEVYMAVVGPVRTGKSTFIRRFMEMLVLPRVSDASSAEITDQLPVSGSGKTITTVEPKFIPKKAIPISLGPEEDKKTIRLRLIDCVGYMVDGATGHLENGVERMVRTPWNEQDIPFSKAAEIGTRKVIFDHSTIGIVMTTDGSFGELPRENYLPAEERTISELKSIGKPFLIVLNTNKPGSRETKELLEQMMETYGVPVLAMDCEQLRNEDVEKLFTCMLSVFPITEIAFYLPRWMELLDKEDVLYQGILEKIRQFTESMSCMRDIKVGTHPIEDANMEAFRVEECNMENGQIRVGIEMKEKCYYEILSNIIGEEVTNEYQFMKMLGSLAAMKKEYGKLSSAWEGVNKSGYGVVSPCFEEIELEEPELIRQGNRYGIKIRALAPSVQMIRAEITTEIAPIVGSEEQANDLINYMQGISKENKLGVWDTDVFGKSMGKMVEEGIGLKIARLTEESQRKIQESMQKIVNESNGGLVCFII